MAWKSHGLRGSDLEERVNYTIGQYRKNGLAVIQKVPTPITPVQLDGKGHITLAYFEQKSTVDYIGAVQGIPVCFDAKESKTDTFPLANIHEHQITFMKDFERQGGISFFLVYFSTRAEYYYLSLDEAERYWSRMKEGGRKSFRYDELDPAHFLSEARNGEITILDGVNVYLQELDSRKEQEAGCSAERPSK